jgi:hypothetical protein
VYALEMLVTQIIAEQFQSVPGARERPRDARDCLSALVDQMQFDGMMLDEEARLRPRVRECVNDILDVALCGGRSR